ncbi:Predicted arabinose efflux permease, MFS family [Amycolatopsis lurida]|uniref:Major facilitator transporter n=1 Tax=Amycolatopsis lurida NRRL 2430 TaxID=1460371 RepID=A0A2P2FKJ3_AMYLU|nr:MFS transporter [Amycolatopsis lurida]KFU77247.1 major facilitator transporter [Amycolatopsis lurida NRRL 2430]SEB36278.1 Predicted arabinose efflux permease, MFS family [Amycolatopsis lurida]
MGGRSLGRRFGWLWAAYAASAFGTRFAFDAFSLIAIVALGAGTTEVSLLAAAGLVVGAVVALPLGPWVEFRRKRPVMIAMDLIRCAALLTVPVAYAFGLLGFGQLLAVSVVVAAADITFLAASGAFLKTLLPPEDLLIANARFESTTWTATVLGPPLGGFAVGLFGPVITIAADAVSYLLSAIGIRVIGGWEPPPPAKPEGPRLTGRDLREGWRFILTHPLLRPLFVNTIVVNGLIMATAPLMAVLMLGQLGFAPWEYAVAFAVPCLGGLIGARLSRTVVARYGRDRVLFTAGWLRVCWPVGLVFVQPGVPGLILVIAVEFCLITCIGVFNPVLATSRLEQVPLDRAARTLSAWSIAGKLTTASLTALWGLLAAFTGPRAAVGIAGALMLATPLLLPRNRRRAVPVSAHDDQESGSRPRDQVP